MRGCGDRSYFRLIIKRVADQSGKAEAADASNISEGKNPLETHHFLHGLLDCCQEHSLSGACEHNQPAAAAPLSVELPAGESAGDPAGPSPPQSPAVSDFVATPVSLEGALSCSQPADKMD